MPNRVTKHPTTTTERVPVGLFLPAQHSGDTAASWRWLSPSALAHLIHRYTVVGDTVLNLDGHPAITAASHHLDRTAASQVTDRDPAEAAGAPALGISVAKATVALGTVQEAPLADLTQTIARWRRLLRPGGHLVLALAGPPITEEGSLRTTVVTAARAAGLVYHQHIPVVLVPLSECDSGPADIDRHVADERLYDRPHARTHRDLLIFATTTTEVDRG
jgi:SAM-dependent methyltransferase